MNEKKLNRITAIAVSISVIICMIFIALPKGAVESATYNFEYPEKLFGTDIIEINIETDDASWESMLDNATAETYIACDVTVNGTTFPSVGVRPKGNSSLSMVAGSDSDRFSFKFQFDEYIDGQTCFGLDKFVVNNMQADYTYMKEYFSYYLMDYMGVDAPLYNYAHITVNGEEWGLYLAVETYEDSFVQRVYGTSEGNLYSVKMEMGRGREESGGDDQNFLQMMPGAATQGGNTDGQAAFPNMQGGMSSSQGNFPELPEGMTGMQGNMPEPLEGMTGMQGNMPELPEGMTGMPDTFPGANTDENSGGNGNESTGSSTGENPDRSKIQGMGGGMGGGGFGGMGGSNGGSLAYNGDNSESYSSIFNNAVFNKSDEEDFQRVIKALEKLSLGEDLEEYFDVDQILRYLAVHTTVVNLDSYSSSMQQNYYLYENDGKVTILPWDYNLAFGGFQSGDAASAVNFAIDTPVSGVELSERPLIAKLLEVPEYKERYHQYLQDIADYLSGGQFTEQLEAVDSLISDYVANDATAFCTFEQYKSAVETFEQFCLLRAESIQGQLDGTIPSTTDGQGNSEALINADGILLNTMGSQGGGFDKGGGNGRMDFGGKGGFSRSSSDDDSQTSGGAIRMPGNSGNGQISSGAVRTPGNSENGQTSGGAVRMPDNSGNGQTSGGAVRTPGNNGNGQIGWGNMPDKADMQSIPAISGAESGGSGKGTDILWMGVSALTLAAGILFAKVYKRR